MTTEAGGVHGDPQDESTGEARMGAKIHSSKMVQREVRETEGLLRTRMFWN